MEELNKSKSSSVKGNSSGTRKSADNDIISLKECRAYFKDSDVSDSMVKTMRNNLVGIVDSVINTYLEEFR